MVMWLVHICQPRLCNHLQNVGATTYKNFLQLYAKSTCKKQCYKYRMSFRRCLFTIIRDYCRSFSLCNKFPCMLPNSLHSLFIYVIYIFLLQAIETHMFLWLSRQSPNIHASMSTWLVARVNENCYGIWNCPVSQTAAYTILLLSLEFHYFRLMCK